MKKVIGEERAFCDICEEPRYNQCLVCGQDLCDDHSVELKVRLCGDKSFSSGFEAYLCPAHALPLLKFLKELEGKSVASRGDDWLATGHNPQFNEVRLTEILDFLKRAAAVA